MPNYTHDCGRCIYLGDFTYDAPLVEGTERMTVDLYLCPSVRDDGTGGGTLISRESSECGDYASTMVSYVNPDTSQDATATPALREAKRRAYKMGLIKCEACGKTRGPTRGNCNCPDYVWDWEELVRKIENALDDLRWGDGTYRYRALRAETIEKYGRAAFEYARKRARNELRKHIEEVSKVTLDDEDN